MKFRPIRTEADYEAALRRIEALSGASAGSSEADELDVLVTLAEAYEREHYTVDQPDPKPALRASLTSGVKGVASRRLASMGGTMPQLKNVPRRRPRPSKGRLS